MTDKIVICGLLISSLISWVFIVYLLDRKNTAFKFIDTLLGISEITNKTQICMLNEFMTEYKLMKYLENNLGIKTKIRHRDGSGSSFYDEITTTLYLGDEVISETSVDVM